MKYSTAIVCLSVIVSTILGGCSWHDAALDYALETAGSNRPQLESVLEHYRTTDADAEKYAAARFLIENMPPHYSYKGDEILQYYEFALDILLSDLTPEQQKDTLIWYSDNIIPIAGRMVVQDLKIIKSDYLIENIDKAFAEWRSNPWSRHVRFEDFCEWILPYKVTEYQNLDHWRDTLQTYYSDAIQNMIPDDEEYNTCFKTLDFVRNDILAKVKPYGVYTDAGYPLLSASLLPHQTFGRCADYVNLGVLTYRSLGLPAIIDETPYWGRYRAGHEWYVILGDRGQELPAEWDLGSVPGWQFFPFQRIPKVYRNTYSMNLDRVRYRNRSAYRYDFNVCQQDVTEKYMKPVDIEIPIKKDINTGKRIRLAEKYAYIAVFSGRDTDWSIVDFGQVSHGKARFTKIGTDILYIALGYDGSHLLPVSSPFVVEKDGCIRYIHANLEQLQSVDVRRKYYQSTNVVNMRRRILGARIQYADRPDFKDSVTVCTITDTDIPDKLPLPDGIGAHRYWRYLGADGTYGSIAELTFFNADTVQLTGTPAGSASTTQEIWSRAFDGDWLSNFETPEGYADRAWIGMSFQNPQAVRYVRVAPRSDENDIIPGHEYELFWWDDVNDYWHTCGIRTATDNVLHYDSIASGTLLWLRDYTHGWDERPFIIRQEQTIDWR